MRPHLRPTGEAGLQLQRRYATCMGQSGKQGLAWAERWGSETVITAHAESHADLYSRVI